MHKQTTKYCHYKNDILHCSDMERNMKHEEFEKLSFEEALQKLETIVRDLEGGRIKLDDAVEAYERAVALKKFCEDKLKSAELKIEKIEVGDDGSLKLQPLDGIENNE